MMKSPLRIVKTLARKVLDTHPKKFSYRIDYLIKNLSDRSLAFDVCMPLAQTGPTQRRLSNPELFGAEYSLRQDEYGNEYAVCRLQLTPRGEHSLLQSGKVEVQPHRPAHHPAWSVMDYQALLRDPLYQLHSAPNRLVRPGDKRIQELAFSLSGSSKISWTLLQKLYFAVSSKLKYGSPYLGLYSAVEALDRERVDCGGFDSLLLSICGQLGIPGRIVSGFWVKSSLVDPMHAWVEVMLPDKSWLPLDPSLEHLARQGRTTRVAGFARIGADRIVFGYGQDTTVRWADGSESKADIFQHPFIRSQTPIVPTATRMKFHTTGI